MYQTIPDFSYYKKQERELLASHKKAYLSFEELKAIQEDEGLYKEGYKTYTGHVLTQAEANALNKYTVDLNRTTAIHMREFLKDKRHQLFCIIAQNIKFS